MKAFLNVGLSIASNGSEDSKLSIKGYEQGKPEIGDWLQIDEDYEGLLDFYKMLQTGELDEFISDVEVCISTNYRGLSKSRLYELIKERGLEGVSKSRDEMVGILLEDDRISQLHCTKWQIENYNCSYSKGGKQYSF